jgi:ParB family transcriptional regulator, chromosome partitioning protein
MARKNLLAGLTGAKLTAVNPESTAPAARPPGLSFAGRGAVGAVTRSIEDLAAKAHAAKELEARLTSGQVIVALDPAEVDASFMADRMAQDDAEFQALKDSIAQSGQDSPILVRPHPQAPGRYQVAFGHRRLRAARDLGQPVRAVVRPLTDRELILAQGQENSARANLSFIERARFAARLEEGGYDRETIMQALSVDKTTVSRLITVVQRIPVEIIDAIGPAPSTGRDRWVELAGLFQKQPGREGLHALLASAAFQTDDSDERFQQVLARLGQRDREGEGASAAPDTQDPTGREPARHWAHSSGARVLKVASTDRATVLTIDRRAVPGFDAFLLERMETLYSAFLAQSGASRRKR